MKCKRCSNECSTKGYISISQFADFVGITPASLGHYDNEGIFMSAHKCTEINKGHRFYSPVQVTTAKMIKVLTRIKVPLDEIKEVSQRRTPESMLKLLTK